MSGLRFTHGDRVAVDGRAGTVVGVWSRTMIATGARQARWSIEFDDAPGAWKSYDDDAVTAWVDRGPDTQPRRPVITATDDGPGIIVVTASPWPDRDEQMRAETAAIQRAVAQQDNAVTAWAHDPLTRERLARRYEACARNEGRRTGLDQAYERGRRDAYTAAAAIARDNGVWEG